jgi:NADPH-dependent 2,4-dienoyl-CoA reductase/sulfur reductase-like enzyme
MPGTELAVIGAGPAGLAAAITAARAGVQVTLIDEYPQPGGQYLKGASYPNGSPPVSATERQGRTLLPELAQLEIELRLQTLVWGLEEKRLALHGSVGVDWLEAEAIIVATGAREVVVPFPGWTLPGVMTLGAAQLLAKGHGVLPGKRVLLAGSGPLLLPVANELAQQGAEVVAVLEATHPGQWLSHGMAVWGNWDRLGEGWHYWRGLRQAGIPYRFGRTVIWVEGSSPSPSGGGPGRGHELERAVVAQIDREGYPVSGTEESYDIDTLCLGFGFVPNVELTQLAGCEHRFDPQRGGWVPTVDERLETTVSGLFAAGETAGIGGAGAAMLGGRVAGLTAARRLGHVDEAQLVGALARLAGQRQRLQRFGAMLNTLFFPRPGLNAITTRETILCRCEEVSAGEVWAAVANNGVASLDALKNWTRVGQGPCQGRTCGPILTRLVTQEAGCSAERAGCFRVRPPLKPVALGELASGGNQ